MERSTSNDQPMAPLPKRAVTDASHVAPRPPGLQIGIGPSATDQPPPLIMSHSPYVPTVGGHERSYFPGTISDPSHPDYQPYQPYQLDQASTEPSSSYQPSEIGEGDEVYSDEEVGMGQEMEEVQGEGYGQDQRYTVHIIQPNGAWSPDIRMTPYLGHPPAKPDFAVNHFLSSEARLARLAEAFNTNDQTERLRRILGPYSNVQISPSSRLSNNKKRTAKDTSFTVTPEGGVRLGRSLKREGEWKPDTEAGRAAYERDEKEKEALAKQDPEGYPRNGIAEWREDTDKEDAGAKKKKKNKKKSKKKGKKAVQADEGDSGSEEKPEVDELEVAEEGDVPASAELVKEQKSGDVDVEMTADVLEPASRAESPVLDEAAVGEEEPAMIATTVLPPTPEPEAAEVDSEEERMKRRADKLRKEKERKAAKKERSAKRKEALGIVKKPHTPLVDKVEEAQRADIDRALAKPQAKPAEEAAKASATVEAGESTDHLEVAAEVQAGRVSPEVVQAISIEQTALQHIQPTALHTPKPKPYIPMQPERNTTQSPLSAKTPLRPPQADRLHERHVSAKAKLSWTHLVSFACLNIAQKRPEESKLTTQHDTASVSINVTPPARPVSTPPLVFLAVPTSPAAPTPAGLACIASDDLIVTSSAGVEGAQATSSNGEDIVTLDPRVKEGYGHGDGEGVGAEDDAEEAAAPDLTSSSTQTTYTAHLRTPESSPLRPLSKLPIEVNLENAQEEEKEGETMPQVHVESPSSRKVPLVQNDNEEQDDRIASPTPTEMSTDIEEAERGGMLDVSYVQECRQEAVYQGEDAKDVAAEHAARSDQASLSRNDTSTDFDRPLPLAQTFILYFSDTDKKRLEARAAAMGQLSTDTGGRSSAQSYSNGLVELIESSDVADLFGKWKALRRQVAEMTGREIEPIGHAPAVDKMGLGLHAMSDDHNFQFFVKGVKPMWEDKTCKMGGKISFVGSCEQLDSFFFETVLILISNVLPTACPSPGADIQVVGVAFGRKPKPASARVDIWFGGMARVPVEYVMAVQAFLVEHIKVDGVQVLKGGYKEFFANVHGHGHANAQGGMGGARRVPAPGVQGSFGVGHARSISGTERMGSFGQGQAMGAFASFGSFGSGQVNQYQKHQQQQQRQQVEPSGRQTHNLAGQFHILQPSPTLPRRPSTGTTTVSPEANTVPVGHASPPAVYTAASPGIHSPGMVTSPSVPLVDVLAIPTDPMQSTVLPSSPLVTPLVTPRVSPRPAHMSRPVPPHQIRQASPHMSRAPYHDSLAEYGRPEPLTQQIQPQAQQYTHPRPPRTQGYSQPRSRLRQE